MPLEPPPRPLWIRIEFTDGCYVVLSPDEFWARLHELFFTMPAVRQAPKKPYCPECNGTGLLFDGYCHCQTGRDLASISNRLRF